MSRTSVAAILLALLAACGGDDATGPTAPTTTAATTAAPATTDVATTAGATSTTTAVTTSSTVAPSAVRAPLLLAVDAITGAERFALPVDSTSDTFSGIVVDGELVLGLGGRCDGEPATARAFDRMSGVPRWSTPLTGSAELSGPLSTDGGVIVVATGTNGPDDAATSLAGLDAATGEQLWVVELGPITDVQLVLDQPLVMASFQPAGQDGGPFTLVAIDRATGRRRWETTGPGTAIVGTDDEVVVAQVFDGQPAMVGLDAATGEQVWRNEDIEATYVPPLGGGVVANTVLTGGVVGFDMATGEPCWQRPDLVLPELVEQQAGTGGSQSLFARTADPVGDTLEFVELADGRTLYPVPNDAGLIPTEHALLVNDDTTLQVKRLDDGTPVGAVRLPPAEPDQVTVLPAVSSDLTVYLGRGCPGRGLSRAV